MNRASTVVKWIVNEFATNIQTPLYSGIAPEGSCHPFITFNLISDTPYRTFCGDKGSYQIQFSVFNSIGGLSGTHDIMNSIRDLLDDKQDKNNYIEFVSYDNSFTLVDVDNKGWQGIVLYTIYMV
jgi:hypothetical protein